MTREQFERWRDFAVRMAERGYPDATRHRTDKIQEKVQDYFSWREFQNDWPEIKDWDGNGDDYYLGDAVNEFFDEYRHWKPETETYGGKFYSQVTCCIRAGFDMAVKQSGGVLGFTVGDLRRMFDGNVPDWIIKNDWDIPLEQAPDDVPIWL